MRYTLAAFISLNFEIHMSKAKSCLKFKLNISTVIIQLLENKGFNVLKLFYNIIRVMHFFLKKRDVYSLSRGNMSCVLGEVYILALPLPCSLHNSI